MAPGTGSGSVSDVFFRDQLAEERRRHEVSRISIVFFGWKIARLLQETRCELISVKKKFERMEERLESQWSQVCLHMNRYESLVVEMKTVASNMVSSEQVSLPPPPSL